MDDLTEDAAHAACVILDLIEAHGAPGVDELILELLSDPEARHAIGCLMHFTYWLDIKIREGPKRD